ncbi:methyltransferase domain-containing protein [Actinoplanes sp. CA-252034]|uniref:methyltransferase domain-containing protein n=1 Tax=Actinoplanes sp. CA-252034 TaxID=3239906 RepID=UPI003D99BE26
MTVDLFDTSSMYDDDYLHFFAAPGGVATPTHGALVGTAYQGESAADLIWRLLDLAPGMNVLDLACGHGTLANTLAARGCRVTGLDSSTVFLDRARADATAAGVDVEYVAGDMRALPAWSGRFDRVINWTTAFGYFDDDTRAYLFGLTGPKPRRTARRRLWARHDVRPRAGAVITFDHPQVCELVLNREKLLVSGTDGIMLVIYHADTGSEAADKLTLLATFAAEYPNGVHVSRAGRPHPGVHTRSGP